MLRNRQGGVLDLTSRQLLTSKEMNELSHLTSKEMNELSHLTSKEMNELSPKTATETARQPQVVAESSDSLILLQFC